MQSPRLDFTAQGMLSLFAIALLVGYAVDAMRPLPETAMELHASAGEVQPGYGPPVLRASNANPASTSAAGFVASQSTLSGTIVRDRTKFVLRDSGGIIYQLDDSTKAEPFEGRSVTITGTLEESARLMHVQQIQNVSS